MCVPLSYDAGARLVFYARPPPLRGLLNSNSPEAMQTQQAHEAARQHGELARFWREADIDQMHDRKRVPHGDQRTGAVALVDVLAPRCDERDYAHIECGS